MNPTGQINENKPVSVLNITNQFILMRTVTNPKKKIKLFVIYRNIAVSSDSKALIKEGIYSTLDEEL